MAVAISTIEFFIPRIPFFPWLKPGLANCITILWIIKFGFIESLLFIFLRTWIVSFYFGFSFITVLLSLSGALCACFVMAMAWYTVGRKGFLGTVGLAILGALSHNAGQLFAVYLIMARNLHLFYQLPLMLIASLTFGSIVGLITPLIVSMTEAFQLSYDQKVPCQPDTVKPTFVGGIFGSILLLLCISLMFIKYNLILLCIAGMVTVLVQLVKRGSIIAFFYPITRFWMLFLFVAIFNSFFTYGTKVPYATFISYEGIAATGTQWIRLWVWLQTSTLFIFLSFHSLLMSGLKGMFPHNKITLYAGLIAAEKFPAIVDMVRKQALYFIKKGLRNPRQAVTELFNQVADTVITTNSE